MRILAKRWVNCTDNYDEYKEREENSLSGIHIIMLESY